MLKTLTCGIHSIAYFNRDTMQVLLDLPAGEEAVFHAGQYLQLLLPHKKCPFSIASSPHVKRQLELHIRPTPGSEDSVAIEKALTESSSLEVEMPLGDCFLTQAPANPLLLLAASTGITQMKSIIEFLEPAGFAQPVYLYWGVVCDQDIYLADLCAAWQAKHDEFHFIPVVSEPETSPQWAGRTGLVGEAALADFDDVSDVTVIVSGGPAMVYATLDAFVARGMPPERMKSDIFSYAPRN